jgi:predicted nucleic acid-binding protein
VTDKGLRVAERTAPPQETLHAPQLIDLEVAQVLRLYVARRQLDDARAGQALDDLRDPDVNLHPHHVLLGRTWELHHNASAYHAVYLALAEVLGAPLLTTDARLGDFLDTTARIEVL